MNFEKFVLIEKRRGDNKFSLCIVELLVSCSINVKFCKLTQITWKFYANISAYVNAWEQ